MTTGAPLGSNDFGSSYTSITYTTQQTGTEGAQTTSTTKTAYQSYEDLQDSIESLLNSAVQFNPQTIKNANMSKPELDPPKEGTKDGPQPYGVTEQKLVKEFFSDQVVTLLRDNKDLSSEDVKTLYNAIMTGEMPTDAKLLAIAKDVSAQATAKTIEQGNLPASWTIDSNRPQDWTPLSIVPYSTEKREEINNFYDSTLLKKTEAYIQDHPELNKDVAAMLLQAVKTGEGTESLLIKNIYSEIKSETLAETQGTFGLSSTWLRGTDNVEDWKPIGIGLITPARVAAARTQEMLNNADQMLNDINEAGQKLLDGLPPNDPARVALTDFLQVIGEAIRSLKATLREIQVRDAEKTKATTQAKFDMLEDKKLRAKEQEAQMAKQAEKQKQMKDMGFAMKIIGPIIAALATVIGAIIAIASLGLATAGAVALIAAGIAVGIAMTAYSVADSVLGLTGKMFEEFKSSLDKMLPDSPDWVKSVVKALIIAAVVAVLVVIVAIAIVTGSGIGSLSSLAANAVAQTVRAAVVETVKQLAMQMILMAVMGSNVLPELMVNSLKAANVQDKNVQIALQAIIMVISFVVSVIAMYKVGGAGLAKKVKDSADEVGNVVKEGASTAASAAKDASQTIVMNKQLDIAGLTKALVKQAVEDVKQALDNLLVFVKQSITQAKEAVTKVVEELLEKFKDQIETMKKFVDEIGKGFEKIGEKMQKAFEGHLSKINFASQAVPQVMNCITGSVKGAMMLEAHRLLKGIGETQSAMEVLQGLIEALEKLLKNMQAGMSNRDDFIAQLQDIYKNLYDSASQSSSKVYSALQG